MQSNEQEQQRVGAALEQSARAQAARFVAARLDRAALQQRRGWRGAVEDAASLAVALAMTTGAIYMFVAWMGW